MSRACGVWVVLGAAIVLCGCESPGLEQSFEFEEPVTDLHVLLEAGDIELIATDEHVARVEADLSYSGGTEPQFEAFVDDSLLRVWLSCDNGCWDLSGRVTVYAPRDVSGKLDTGRGDIRIVGSTGELAAESAAGSIRGDDLLCTLLFATAERGPVVLGFASRPTAVDVDVDRGDISVELPAGAYDIDAHTLDGSVELDAVEADPGCREELTLRTRKGDVVVSGY